MTNEGNNECLSNIKSIEEFTEKAENDITSLNCDKCPNFKYTNGIGTCTKFSNE